MEKRSHIPPFIVSLIPVLFLLLVLTLVVITQGALSVGDYSPFVLLLSALLAFLLARRYTKRKLRVYLIGLLKSIRQTAPTIPVLIFIGMIGATWMFGGIVPTCIYYGVKFINPDYFLVCICLICSVMSVLTGSSWTTCATIGVASMSVGQILGFHPGWIAGAVISGAYFGDKISPLSDTTVLASNTNGVPLFKHVQFLMTTTVPTMTITLIVFAIAGFTTDITTSDEHSQIIGKLQEIFYISPWLMLAPVITCIMIAMRVNVSLTLTVSTVMGFVSFWAFQDGIIGTLLGANPHIMDYIKLSLQMLFYITTIDTGNDFLNGLVDTSGVYGMLPTVYLVVSASIFGGMMLGSGMITSIVQHGLSHIKGTTRIVAAAAGSGLFLNSCTGDQYLSVVLDSNLFRALFRRNNIPPKVLSRTVEDSVSVTSVLIPWNSCGLTQSTVLGVPTLTYLPFCIFNYLSPIMTVTVTAITTYLISRAKMRRQKQ